MLKYSCIWFLLFLCQATFAQVSALDSITVFSKAPSHSKLIFLSNCELAKIVAAQDIERKEVYIFLVGGFAPKEFSTDKNFEKKFNVSFFEYGCVVSDCISVYNQAIFQYLDHTFGKKWRNEIRKDAYSLSD